MDATSDLIHSIIRKSSSFAHNKLHRMASSTSSNSPTTEPNTDSGYRWQVPTRTGSKAQRRLHVLNSFTRRKEPFVALHDKFVKWYSCGPTVYDVAHLGHARSYITFDIIRRIMHEYFGYHIYYVMNITDIDDKIIKKARGNYLCDEFIQNQMAQVNTRLGREQLVNQVELALETYSNRRAQETDPAKLSMIANVINSSREAIASLRTTLMHSNNTTTAPSVADPSEPPLSPASVSSVKSALERLRDVIADEQDSKLAHTVNEHHIFKQLTARYEQEFHEDMLRLNVLQASAVPRVSEYIDEIGDYLHKLESNGYAYRSQGSVYFDTTKFDSKPQHHYAKLVREAYGHSQLSLDEAEGELSGGGANNQASQQQATSEKRSPNDFALWKKSKPGEPSWRTRDYEPGRPGWHIECSVMASHMLGEQFDIHTGGCDLKFPHHDNELAQAEAYYDTGKQWVNYFLHSGHLTISGCKMSKSLKNFITIRQALVDYSARQLRFAFLAHGWGETLDYSPNTMSTALSYERTFKEFFLNVGDTLRRRVAKLALSSSTSPVALPPSPVKQQANQSQQQPMCDFFRKWTRDDHELHAKFADAVDKVDEALCDNFDTRSALNAMSALVKECNKRHAQADSQLLRDVAGYMHRILAVFGAPFDEINIDKLASLDTLVSAHTRQALASSSTSSAAKSSSASGSGAGDDTVILKHVDVLAQFRAHVRHAAKQALTSGSDRAQTACKQMLALCDELRDSKLPNLGVRLEDKDEDNKDSSAIGDSYVVKLVDPETLARERAIAQRHEQERQLKQEAQRLEKLKLQQQRDEKAKIKPSEMFLHQTDKYSKFDDTGVPTHDTVGKELSKSALKKLQKLHAEQQARYDKYIASLQN